MNESTLEQQYDACFACCHDIFEKKLKDYGPNWLLYRLPSLVDEIWRKAKRIRSLEEMRDASQIPEGRDVEYVGIINYSIITLITLGEFDGLPKPDEALENLALLEGIAHSTLSDAFWKVVGDTKDLILKKNHDYSNTWKSMELSSLTDQIIIKTYRIKNILRQDGPLLISEGIDAQLYDIINYAFFALVRLSADAVAVKQP